jgi:hypothetical protein
MPPIIGQLDRTPLPQGLVTRPAGLVGPAAVRGAVGRRQAVDRLHDVQLAAQRPRRAVVDSVAEHPEGGPEALFLGGGVVAEAEGGFELGELARGRGEGVLGFDAGRGPFAVLVERDELDGVAARELEVGVGGGVGLEFVVDVEAGGAWVSKGKGKRKGKGRVTR